jgi:hypothetical protein
MPEVDDCWCFTTSRVSDGSKPKEKMEKKAKKALMD